MQLLHRACVEVVCCHGDIGRRLSVLPHLWHSSHFEDVHDDYFGLPCENITKRVAGGWK